MAIREETTKVEEKTIVSVCNEEYIPGYATVVELTQDCFCDATFVYDQVVSADVWNVCHNLGKKPSVAVVNGLGQVITTASVEHIDNNILIVTLPAPATGKAYLN